MPATANIALIGDFDPAKHRSTISALGHVPGAPAVEWIETDAVGDAEVSLRDYHGISVARILTRSSW